MPETFDVVVIGSGFGGAITAARLAENGYRDGGARARPAVDAGIVSPPAHRRVGVGSSQAGAVQRLVRFSCVPQYGGRAGRRRRRRIARVREHLRQCEDPTCSTSGWPPEITYAELAPHFDAVGAMLDVQKVPANQWPERTRIMKEAAEKNQYGDRFRQLDLAVRFDPAWHYDLPDPHARNARQDVPQRAGPGAGHVRAPR